MIAVQKIGLAAFQQPVGAGQHDPVRPRHRLRVCGDDGVGGAEFTLTEFVPSMAAPGLESMIP
jgi:hypothetical protein